MLSWSFGCGGEELVFCSMIYAGCTIPPSEMCRRYYPRDKNATTTTTTTAAPPKPQPVRFTKLAQNGEGEKTVGKKQHTHSQTITVLTAPTHTQYTPTCTYVQQTYWGFGNHYSKHSMMTMTLRNMSQSRIEVKQVTKSFLKENKRM